MSDQKLLEAAGSAAERAYVPYSGLRVGAVVTTADGTVYSGANVENAAYPSTLCAEAVAIGHAVASGERSLEVVAVISPDLQSIFPCGQCRQRMVEFDVQRVVVEGPDGGPASHTLEELLPGSFRDWREA
ncbi:MAG: cytidine deaminase [Acidimicrobiia bacterium]|nr:cytidine deaminase [Acidimicrobiia bacterium]